MTTTPRLALPLIEPGQAQKEQFHNEALALIDAAVQASAIAIGIDRPPADPIAGSSWIVGHAPTGAWAGQAEALATWTAGGWRFIAAREGMAVWNSQDAVVARFVDGRWESGAVRGSNLTIAGEQVVGHRREAIAAPDGGSVVDAEARSAVAAMLAALRGHGLIAG